MGGRDGESGREGRWWIIVPCGWLYFCVRGRGYGVLGGEDGV